MNFNWLKLIAPPEEYLGSARGGSVVHARATLHVNTLGDRARDTHLATSRVSRLGERLSARSIGIGQLHLANEQARAARTPRVSVNDPSGSIDRSIERRARCLFLLAVLFSRHADRRHRTIGAGRKSRPSWGSFVGALSFSRHFWRGRFRRLLV